MPHTNMTDPKGKINPFLVEGYTPQHVGMADQIYRDLVSRAGLFGKAYFGHKRTRAETARLSRLWRRSMVLAVEVLAGRR